MSQILSQCLIQFAVVSALFVMSKIHKPVRAEAWGGANKDKGKKPQEEVKLVPPYGCCKPH